MNKEIFEKQKYNYKDIVEAVKYGLNYGLEESEDLNVPEGNIQQYLAHNVFKTSEEWYKLEPEIVVINPDGWEKKKGWKKDWYEKEITYHEYIIKRNNSTCIFKKE